MNPRIMRTVWRALGAMGAGALALAAQAASFDCAKAQTPVEHIICGNPELSTLDDELDRRYRAGPQDGAAGAAQRQWIDRRNACADAACVTSAYRARLSELGAPGSAEALPAPAKYVIVQGNGDALCEQVLKRLNEETALDRAVCGIDLLKSIPGVVLPEWKKLSLADNKALYLRFLLAGKVAEQNYAQAFALQVPGGEFSDEVRIPPSRFLLFGGYVTRDQLEREWKDAVDNGYELFRWDGALAEPDDPDVLVVASGADARQGGCPAIRIVRFLPSLRTPMPLASAHARWLLGPEAIPFRYGDAPYRLEDQQGFDRDPQTRLRTVPHRTVRIAAAGNDGMCMIESSSAR